MPVVAREAAAAATSALARRLAGDATMVIR